MNRSLPVSLPEKGRYERGGLVSPDLSDDAGAIRDSYQKLMDAWLQPLQLHHVA
jgi:hypothetical protein